MTRVKICGLCEIDQALAAADYGADYIGLVFAPSRRQITREQAVRIRKALGSTKTRPALVGVFVNLPAKEVNTISSECGLDLAQLSGDESLEYCREIDLPVIKTIHVSERSSFQGINETILKGTRIGSKYKITFLLDTQIKDSYGGTGKTFNWQIAKEVSGVSRVIIAGGLDPDNIGNFLTEVNPLGVDVSSGVESEGKKDLAKIKNFIQKVKSFDGGK
jgi:phosphoribosylanthranilate isomerase